MTSPCKSCRAPILWARTASGARMPLDAEPDRKGNVQLGLVGGEEIAIVLNAADAAAAQVAQLPLYMPHFATCPNASSHRVSKPAPVQAQPPSGESRSAV